MDFSLPANHGYNNAKWHHHCACWIPNSVDDNNQSQTKYVDINLDLDYFQSRNIRSARILEINEDEKECILYIEFITDFFENEKFYIESNQNFKYIEKYKTPIDDRDYITFLFEYKYSLQKIKEFLSLNQDLTKKQIISEKDLINFSAKLIM